MKFYRPFGAREIARIINADKIIGNYDAIATGINEIHRLQQGEICFVDHPKYYDKVLHSPASVIIINKEVQAPEGKALLLHQDPFRAFNQIIRHFLNEKKFEENSIAPTAELGKYVTLGQSVTLQSKVKIGDNVSIGNNVFIGENTIIYPGVRIGDNVKIGKNCLIQYNAVIGGEPFYYKNYGNERIKMERGGGVIIEDFVHIGANTTIDAGVSANTIIGEHTKIDNLVQIGHDTIVGKHCLIASQTGIAGATTIEDEVTIWGQVGIPSGLHIGKKAVLYAKTGVMSDLEGGKVYAGFVAQEARKTWRELASLKRLPEFLADKKKEK